MLIRHFNGKGTTARDRLTTSIPIVPSTAILSDAQALFWKQLGCFDTIRDVYVVDDEHHFVGCFPSREIFRRPLHTPVIDILQSPENICVINVNDDQEHAVNQALAKHTEFVVVVDDHNVLIGAISIKELLKILFEETQEDLAAYGHFDLSPQLDNILEIPLFEAFKNRLPWILVGLVGGIGSAVIVSYFEPVLSTHLVIATFIPLAVYITGALSAQIQISYVRDLALYPTLPFWRYLWRQTGVVCCLALLIAAALLFMSVYIKDLGITGYLIAGSIGLASLSAVVTGVFVPALLARYIKDPANATAPVATIVSDITTLLIFFGITSLFLS